MSQVSSHRTPQQERWLKSYFRTKSAGAEFILPWAVDTFFRAVNDIKSGFSPNELKAVIEVYRDCGPLPGSTKAGSLLTKVMDACENENLHVRFGISRTILESKLRQMDDMQLMTLMIWAAAFWYKPGRPEKNINRYIESS